MPNYMLRLAFIGTNYHGWQIQPDVPTVQGEITRVLERILSEKVILTGCCRTDAGVHAKEYVANFKSGKELEEYKILRGLNSLLPRDIGVYEVRRVPETWNARYSVKEKVYLYRIWNWEARNPFLYPFSWHVPRKLNPARLEEVVRLLSGVHDFSGFAKLEEDRNTVINLSIELSVEEPLLELRFRASHFLRYMVRRLVGAIVSVGEGRIGVEEIASFLEGRRCPYTAPPHGLTLEKVILSTL